MKLKITHLYDHKTSETLDGDASLVYKQLAEKFPIVARFGESYLTEAIKRLNRSQFVHIEVL